ncbi:MAG: cardiolipin synthase [Cetobacterium sp.]
MEIIIGILRDYLIVINIFLAAIVIFFERKRPVYTLFWITILLLTSYFGFIMYLFFGMSFKKKNKLKRFYSRKFLKHTKFLITSNYIHLLRWKELIHYLEVVSNSKITFNNEIKIFNTGEDFFKDMTTNLLAAENEIKMEYFIFNDDELGSHFYNILTRKAAEGIKISLIVDGAGTRDLSKRRIKDLKTAGVDIGIFFPSYFPFLKIGNLRANYRDHRKLCIIDQKICYTGGLNIGDEYVGRGKLGSWRDTGLKVEGECVLEFEKEFMVSWNFVKNKLPTNRIDDLDAPKFPIKHEDSLLPIQVVSSGPNYEFRTIRDSILKMIIEAKKYIYIQTPYFIPDDTILDALKIAILSGVDVRVMIPSIPDHLFVYWANQSFYGEIINLGAKIYKYQDGFLHSKGVIVDDEIAAVGTANFDYRSFYQNFEINIMIYGIEVKKFKDRFYRDSNCSILISKDEYKNRGNVQKIKESICRLVAPIL